MLEQCLLPKKKKKKEEEDRAVLQIMKTKLEQLEETGISPVFDIVDLEYKE